MFESRSCFLFSIFVTSLFQWCLSVPQISHSADFYSSHHPYYGYDSQQTSYYASGSPNYTLTHTPYQQPNQSSIATFQASAPQPFFGQTPLSPNPSPVPLSPYHQSGIAPQQSFPEPSVQPPIRPSFYTPPIPTLAMAPAPQYTRSDSISGPPSHPIVQTSDFSSFHHHQPAFTVSSPVTTSSQLTYAAPHAYAPYAGLETGGGVASYAPANDPFNFHTANFMSYQPHHLPQQQHHHHQGMMHSGVAGTPVAVTQATTKKMTPTTTRPKTTRKATPKPLEVELSVEDFFYLTQLQQLFNKSGNKQSTDFSSLISGPKSGRKSAEDKDESPVFYGGVFDLEELAKIDNMKDLMEAFRKVEPKIQVPWKDSEQDERTGDADENDGGDEEHEVQRQTAVKQRKGSHDATRTRSQETRRRFREKQSKKRKTQTKAKESDRVDHGDSGPQDDEENADDEETSDVDDDDGNDEAKISIGSRPTSWQLGSSGRRKKERTATAVPPASTTTTSPPVAVPAAMYPSPYLYSMPYAYPHLQQQYMHQLQQAMSGTFTPSHQAEKEVSKFPDEDPLVSPNENRNIINVNIADPQKNQKVGDSGNGDSSHVQDSDSRRSHALRFPLRRGSFNSMANGLAKKAISSIFYRIFPTMKHLNVKGVAARGCRDVQSIGSLDSIIMPLGLAVTLHPLLLPLVPFLLLALGSIKAIESATCFVSEYFT